MSYFISEVSGLETGGTGGGGGGGNYNTTPVDRHQATDPDQVARKYFKEVYIEDNSLDYNGHSLK